MPINKENTKQTLLKRYQYDGIPSFALNKVRRKYRRKLIHEIAAGMIKLDSLQQCLCGSADFVAIAEKDRFGLPFRNLMCTKCGLISVDPLISEPSLPYYYASIYHPLILGKPSGSIVANLVHNDQGARIYRFMRKNLRNFKKLSVCEVGCAGGSNLLQFAEAAAQDGIACKLYGCEYEPHYAEEAKRNGIVIRQGGITSMADVGAHYDVVILSHVFEHFYDPGRELALLAPLLTENGLLFIEVPGVLNLEPYLNDLLHYLVHAHLHNFNLASLTTTLSLSGFSLLSGNENCSAVFKRCSDSDRKEPFLEKDNASSIYESLVKAEEKRRQNKNLVKRCWKLLWQSYFRTENLIIKADSPVNLLAQGMDNAKGK